ncbi:fused response regulator/phosphatase [Streptomyces sp. NPDC005727]|uniref:fused response regulator/phosphatase n=1 Tax=Streptomyces sp. NPDC005727 TaxID=3157053 RepID=UPI0034037284
MSHALEQDRSPARILVVDDNPTNRYVLATTLRRAGHQVIEAEDGTRALELLAPHGDEPPEAAVVDVRLPDMTGLEVCERIKSDPLTASIPVINISASAITVQDRTQGLYRGADAYLVEPIAPDELLATITASLRYARARRRAERLAERLHLLNEVTLALYSAPDANQLVHATAQGAAAIFRCDAAAILTTPQGNPVVAHTWHDTPADTQAAQPQAHPAPGWGQESERVKAWATSGQTIPLPCLPTELKDPANRRVVIGRAKTERPPVALLVPAGALTTQDDERLLTQLTQACALALEALRSYSEEHALALTLQRSFLPESLPKTARAHLAVRYLPASDHTEIGGDFYEAIDTPAGLVVAVGDVAGHSLDAAMVMGQIRHALRAYATEGHPPEVILSRLDRLLTTVEPGATVTLCVVLVAHHGDTLHIANAGHLPPLLRAPDGTTAYVTQHGPLLGLGLPHPPAHQVTAPPGTLLLLVTDGLIERRHEDLQTSLKSLAEVAGEGSTDPEETCTRLLERLSPDGNDDVALMAVRLNPAATG